MPGPHKNLFASDGFQTSFNDLTTFGLVAMMAYEPQETGTQSLMMTWLGFNSFQYLVPDAVVMPNMLVALADDGIVVSIEGTTRWQQVCYYAALAQEGPAVGISLDTGVHLGFLSLFAHCLAVLSPVIASLPASLPIVFVGHSLGGAMAQLLAAYYFLNSTHPVANCVVFCCPMVGDGRWVTLMRRIGVLHVRQIGDIIPSLPPPFSSSQVIWPVLGPILGGFQVYEALPRELVFDVDGNYEWRGRHLSDNFAILLLSDLSATIGGPSNSAQAPSLWDAHSIDRIIEKLKPYRENADPLTNDQYVQNQLLFALKEGWKDSPAVTASNNVFATDILNNYVLPAPPTPLPNPLPSGISIEVTSTSHQLIDFPEPRTGVLGNVCVGGGPAVDALLFGQVQRPFWYFRGNDRRLLTKLAQVLYAIQVHDAKLKSDQGDPGAPAPDYIIDPTNDALVAACQLLQERVDLLWSVRRVND